MPMNEHRPTINQEGISVQELLARGLGPNNRKEQILDQLIKDLTARGEGKPIFLPNGQLAPSQLGPSNAEIQLETIHSIRVILQSLRFIMLAIHAMNQLTDSPIHRESPMNGNESLNAGNGT